MNANDQSFKHLAETSKNFDVVLFHKNRWMQLMTVNEDLPATVKRSQNIQSFCQFLVILRFVESLKEKVAI